ncbi:MAG: DUF1513 domain-containing protein [Pseudomonadota bacterium]
MAAARPSRRRFLAGAAAAGLAPNLTWADAGNPTYLAAARLPDEIYLLFGLDAEGQVAFEIPLPARGHAAAGHPERPEAVAFARRPGTFAIVLDCTTGAEIARLTAPQDRHFYGHGAFSRDGSRLYTTENDYELGDGRVGSPDADDGYRRVGEIASGGIGPHDILRLPGSDTLVIANGGIDTHPDTGREKLNLPTMQSNLTYLDPSGGVIEQVALLTNMRLNSIRHLAVRADGTVAFGCQWQGDLAAAPPLVGLHRQGQHPRLLAPPDNAAMNGYVGSVSFSGDRETVAVTAPRGNRAVLFNVDTGDTRKVITSSDICGVAQTSDGLLLTTGTGAIKAAKSDRITEVGHLAGAWDNHLTRIANG